MCLVVKVDWKLKFVVSLQQDQETSVLSQSVSKISKVCSIVHCQNDWYDTDVSECIRIPQSKILIFLYAHVVLCQRFIYRIIYPLRLLSFIQHKLVSQVKNKI